MHFHVAAMLASWPARLMLHYVIILIIIRVQCKVIHRVSQRKSA
jgi:hypothetical protein